MIFFVIICHLVSQIAPYQYYMKTPSNIKSFFSEICFPRRRISVTTQCVCLPMQGIQPGIYTQLGTTE